MVPTVRNFDDDLKDLKKYVGTRKGIYSGTGAVLGGVSAYALRKALGNSEFLPPGLFELAGATLGAYAGHQLAGDEKKAFYAMELLGNYLLR